MIALDRFDHLVITCRDLQASIRFYCDVLGMREVTFGQGRKAVAFGRQKINLHDAAAPGADIAALPAAPTPGSADLCFILASPLEDVVAHLASRGVAVHEGPVARTGALGAMTSIYVRDPDGNLLELSRYDT